MISDNTQAPHFPQNAVMRSYFKGKTIETKMEGCRKGILAICSNYLEYHNLQDIHSRINAKSEVAYWYNLKYWSGFQKHIRPIFQDFDEQTEREFIFQEYLFSVGL